MSAVAPMTAVQRAPSAVSHVFGEFGPIGGQAARVAAVIDPAFLAEVGWNPVDLVLAAPAGHRLLIRPVCGVPGCEATALSGRGMCQSCRRRLTEHGLAEEEAHLLPVQAPARRGPGGCLVADCAREWESSTRGLCRTHGDLRRRLAVPMPEFLTHPLALPLPALQICDVVACARQRRGSDTVYCHAHQQRVRTALEMDPGLDEARWQRVEPPVSKGGEVVFRGLAPLVTAQVLVGLQQRCRLDGVKSKEANLRALVNDLRLQQVATLDDYVLAEPQAITDGTFLSLVNAVRAHARRALASPETEVLTDEWDLAVFGHRGTVDFTKISQGWLRETAKRWAADDLPKRRIRPDRITSGGGAVRHHVGCLVRLSESLRMRGDRGEFPAALGRVDMEAFLHRLAYLESVGQITGDARVRACREVRAVLTRARAMGLTRPGGIAAHLGEDFAIHLADVPVKPERGESGRDLPPQIMQQICAHLDDLTTTEMRTAVELAIDTGRRPEEIAALAFDCLARDQDGSAVLVYDNHKANRPQQRLPISETTAKVILAQQHRVRARFPHTPVADLKLLPTDRRNPDGRKAITAFTFGFHHRTWVNRMPVLTTSDGIEFDKDRIVLYAYRHTYAQRHADAGVPIDVLRELMSHRKLDTTKQYYRVGENRRREAVDRVAALQFDRHGNRIWRQAQALLDSEHVRRSVGEVAVPFGVCAEPSNVKAGGNACPYRFRCAGCDHFRTDVSYLPDLQAYLDDLLRNRERVLAATDVDQWARAEALPSAQEITRIRRLITRIQNDVDQLTADQRTEIDQAIAAVRRHRTTMLGMPRVRPATIQIRPEQTA